MEFNLTEMLRGMGIPAIVVAVVLSLMGLASLTVFVERLITMRRSRSASKKFSAQVADDLQHGRFDAAISAADGFKAGHLARVVRTGLTTYRHAQQTADVSGLTPVDQTQRHMERYMEEISADLRRGLSLLASVGSTAPFVGLLGTVLRRLVRGVRRHQRGPVRDRTRLDSSHPRCARLQLPVGPDRERGNAPQKCLRGVAGQDRGPRRARVAEHSSCP